MKRKRRTFLLALTCGIFFTVFCGLIAVWAEDKPPRGVTRLAVMPFFRGEEPADVEAVLSCSLDQFCPEQVDVAPEGTKVVTDLSWKAIQRQYSEWIVPQEESWEVFSHMQAFGVFEGCLYIFFGGGL